MPKKLEHIGIAVKDLGKSEVLFEKLLNTSSYKREEVASEGVITSFFQIGEIKIELLAATKPDSPIAKFIDNKGEGIHHLAFESDSINDELEHLNNEGIELVHQQPKDGADNKEIAFLHPKSTGGVLWELCQEKKA